MIIPAYNAQTYIAEAIESIQGQTYSDWELIVVNDGSTDQTLKIIEVYKQEDDRIKIINQVNQGEAMARLSGLAVAQAESIYFLDADDVSYPQTLQRLSESLTEWPDAIAAFGLQTLITEAGQPILTRIPVVESNVPLDVLPKLLEKGFVGIGAILIRKSYIMPEDFVSSLVLGGDQFTLCRVATRGNFVFIGGDSVSGYRQHKHSQLHRFQGDLNKHEALSQRLFTDLLICSYFSTQQIARYRQIRLLFTFYYGLRLCLRQQAYKTAGLYFWYCFQTLARHPRLWRRLSQLLLSRLGRLSTQRVGRKSVRS